jgi:hypothetical protein
LAWLNNKIKFKEQNEQRKGRGKEDIHRHCDDILNIIRDFPLQKPQAELQQKKASFQQRNVTSVSKTEDTKSSKVSVMQTAQ